MHLPTRAVFLCLLCVILPAAATSGAADSLRGKYVIMALSAHPDDEDGAALALYHLRPDVRVFSIFYTRGEGGQNEIGPQLGEDLGKIRTGETLRAASILGSRACFLGFRDFGFSKTARETFAKWGGRDSVLARIVYFIRALRPDIIITNHDTIQTAPLRQHGNHQAVGITAWEAFDSAASPGYHADQSRNDLPPWQVHKLYFRDQSAETRPGEVTLTDTATAPDGRTVRQIALEALSQHRTQGMDRIAADSMSQFFLPHHYILVRSDSIYPFDPSDLLSGLKPREREILPISQTSDTVPGPATNTQLPGKRVNAAVRPGMYIGLVRSYDNTLELLFTRMAIRYHLLDSADLATGRLARYTTIILDLRAYFYRHDLAAANGRLMAYIRNGGHVLCFYHKPSDWNDRGYAPAPIVLTGERVTVEESPVTMLIPGHPLFTSPNRITADDWNDWIQERSVYLPSGDTTFTSPKYQRLLACSDPGERQPSTSLLWMKYGKGTYTYCALALYRQLRILNDGAVKLFCNLISR